VRATLLAADDVDPLSLFAIHAVLAAGGIDVEIAATEPLVSTAGGARLVPNRLGWDLAESDILVVPAGLAPKVAPSLRASLLADAALAVALQKHARAGRALAAVADGALVLARVGSLDGRRVADATAWRDELQKAGAEIARGERVVADGHLVTAATSADAAELALLVLTRASGAESAERARHALGLARAR
jgi:putative intracellular protease/amidase